MTKSTLFHLLIIICLVQSACKSDDDLNSNSNIEFSNCLAEEVLFVNPFQSDWCTQDSISDIEICEIIEIETPFRLSETDKAWQPYYCLDIGSPVHYHNEAGDQTTIVITNKSFSELETRLYQASCSSDSTLQTKYCIRSEFANISFVSETLDQEMTIRLSPLVDIIDVNNTESGTQIQISSFQQMPFNFANHFSAIVDQGNLSASTNNFNFSSEFTVLDQTFFDVYSYEGIIFNQIPILYNQEYGIVSFIDKSGERWVINK